MIGSCHCGAVQVQVAHRPPYVNFCNCSLCAKTGGVWGYYEEGQVQVEGHTSSYRRADYDEPQIELYFCPRCGATTHWVTTEHFDGKRVGVNMRIFEPAELKGIEARFLDGRNWVNTRKPGHRRPTGVLGEDVFI